MNSITSVHRSEAPQDFPQGRNSLLALRNTTSGATEPRANIAKLDGAAGPAG